MAPFDELRRLARNNGIRRHIFRDNGQGSDDGSISDRDALHDYRSMAKPGVMADDDATRAPPVEYRLFFLFVRPVILRAIHEVVQRGAVIGMLAGIDADVGRDIHKLAECRIGYVGIAVGVAVIAEDALSDAGTGADLDIAAKFRADDYGAVM